MPYGTNSIARQEEGGDAEKVTISVASLGEVLLSPDSSRGYLLLPSDTADRVPQEDTLQTTPAAPGQIEDRQATL